MTSHSDILIIPAVLESYRSLKDRTYKLTFETGELSPDKLSGVGKSLQQAGFLAFKVDPFKFEESEFLSSLESGYEDRQKTESQRLRAVLYRCWEQEPEDYDDFHLYYRFKMEKLINHFKAKLP